MAKYFLKSRTVAINNQDLSNILEATIDKLGPKFEDFLTIESNFEKHAEIADYAEGTLKVKMYDSSSSHTAPDMIALAVGHGKFDTTNDFVNINEDEDVSDYDTTMNRYIEARQVNHSNVTYIDLDTDGTPDDERALAQSFVARGEAITALKLKFCTPAAAADAESFDVELWTDSASSPNAKLTNTNTITINNAGGADDATNDNLTFANGTTDSTATWQNIDMSADTPNLMGTATLTKGTTYWIVLRNAQTEGAGGGDKVYFSYEVADSDYDDGVMKKDNSIQDSPAWGDKPAGALDLSFVIEFETTSRLTLVITDVTTKGGSTGNTFTFTEVTFTDSGGIECSPLKVTEHTLRWKAFGIAISNA